MEFNRIVTYPMESDEWVKTVLIGGVLLFFGFLIVPMFIVYGYVVQAIRGSLQGDPEPPVFSDWGTLLVEGVKAWVIGLVYLIIPLLVLGITVGGSVLAAATGGDAGAVVGTGGLLIGITVSAVLLLVFGYLTVVAIVNFAREGRVGAAFDFAIIKTVAVDREYAVAWLVSVVIFIGAGVLTMIPLVGWIIAPFATFYASIVAANLWGAGFTRALDSTGSYDPQTDNEPAV